jgi:prepilin-type N-terminal cleavage/methylation domain-containing protein
MRINKGFSSLSAFTLIELLVVVATIGILAATAAMGYSAYNRSAAESRLRSDARNITISLENLLASRSQHSVSFNGDYACADMASCTADMPDIRPSPHTTNICTSVTMFNVTSLCTCSDQYGGIEMCYDSASSDYVAHNSCSC